MINFDDIKHLKSIIQRSQKDALVAFVGANAVDELSALRQKNLELLFKTAKKYKVRFLYVGKGEIAGCEDRRQPGGTWPAMWAIAEQVGFPGSCGNTDQYQCTGSETVFPEGSYGGWDLNTGTKLTDQETREKKFNRVVTRER